MTDARRPEPSGVGVSKHARATGAKARLVLGLLGALTIALVAVPLALLVRREYPPIINMDRALTRAAETAVDSSSLLLTLARATTDLGEPLLLTFFTVVLAASVWQRGSGRLALFVVASRVGALVLSSGLKLAVDRTRPIFDMTVATAPGASFPSGHALGSAAFYATAAVLLAPHVRRPRLLLTGAVLVAGVVAASRVLLGVHYLSDVVAGLLLGLGWAAVCAAVFRAWRGAEGESAPALERGVGE